jgi:signal peptidase I
LLLACQSAVRFAVVDDYQLHSVAALPTLQSGDFIAVDKLSPRWRSIEPGELIAYRSPCLEGIYLHRVIATAGQRVEIRCDTVYVDDQPIAEQAVPGECTYDWHDSLADDAWGWTTEKCSEYIETLGAHSYHVLHEANRSARDADKAAIKVALAWDFPVLTDEPQASCATFAHYDFHAAGSVTAHKPIAGVGVCERQLSYVVPAGQLFMLADNRHDAEDSRRFGAVPVEDVIGRVREIFASEGKFGLSFARVSNIR